MNRKVGLWKTWRKELNRLMERMEILEWTALVRTVAKKAKKTKRKVQESLEKEATRRRTPEVKERQTVPPMTRASPTARMEAPSSPHPDSLKELRM